MSGLILKEVVAPWLTVCEIEGEILPFIPADGTILWVSIAKLVVTAQSAVTGAVVYVLPDRVPLQPITVLI